MNYLEISSSRGPTQAAMTDDLWRFGDSPCVQSSQKSISEANEFTEVLHTG